MTALFQHHTILIHFKDTGIVLTDQILDRPHLDKEFGTQFIKGDFLINQVFIRIIIGFQDIHTLVDLFYDLVDRILVGKGSNCKLMYSLYSRGRNRKRLNV